MKKRAAFTETLEVAVEINDRLLFWEIRPDASSDNLQALSAPVVLRVSPEDHRLVVGKRKEKALQRTAVKTVAGMPVFLSSKGIRYFVHSNQVYLRETTRRAIPLMRIMDAARLAAGTASPLLHGLYLGGHPDVLIVWAIHKDGNSSKPRVFLDVGGTDNLDKSLRLVASDNNFTDQYNVQILEASDILTQLSANRRLLTPYPLDSEWYGLPVAAVRGILLALSAVTALTGVGFAGAQKARLAAAEQALNEPLPAQPRHLAVDHILAYTQASSVPVEQGLQTAAQLWLPGTQAVLHMKKGKPTTVELHFSLQETAGGETDLRGVDLLDNLLSQKPPAGYTRTRVQLTPTGEKYVVEFTESRAQPAR